MELWSSLITLAVCCLVSAGAQFITLDIPQVHAGEGSESAFTTYTSKRYYFVTYFKANFFRAHQYCQINNMELLTIDSKEEETAFVNLINSKDFEFKSAKQFWTSGTDLGGEGKFFFLSNGKAIGQLNWANDEPNNAKRADSNETENCMGYTMTDNLKFFRLFDRYCSLQSYFVCQEPQQDVQQDHLNKIWTKGNAGH